MKLNFVEKICPNCNTQNSFICEEAEQNMLSLTAYKKLKNRPVFKCVNCGFCSYNFNENSFNNNIKTFVNNSIYKNTLNAAELNGLDSYITNYLVSYNAYDYECASLVHALQGEPDYAFIALFKAIQLKKVISNRVYKDMLADSEELSEQELLNYEKIVNILTNRLTINFSNLLELFNNTEKNIYEKLLLIEAFCIGSNFEKASELFKNLASKHALPQDLTDYFNSLIY